MKKYIQKYNGLDLYLYQMPKLSTENSNDRLVLTTM